MIISVLWFLAAEILTFTHQVPVTLSPTKLGQQNVPDIARCPLGGKK